MQFKIEIEMNYDEKIIEEASLAHSFYIYNSIEPTVFFWKQLTLHYPHTPLCLIPDTLILNGKENQTIWVYTDHNGHIASDSNLIFKDFISKISSYTAPNQLIAIMKRPTYNDKLFYSNDIKLLNSRYLINCSQQQIVQNDQVVCLQRFIKNNGDKAFICRTIYQENTSNCCYLITNKKKFNEKKEPQIKRMVAKPEYKSTIVKSKQGAILKETSKALQEIVKYFRFQRGIKLTQVVGDFIKDQYGNWWLVNIKAFKMEEGMKSVKVNNFMEGKHSNKERYQKTKACRYCQKNYLQSELTHKITMQMIIEMDKYLIHLGKDYRWLKRSDTSNIDMHCLYQQHRICKRCYQLYSQIQSMMNIEKAFLQKIGSETEKPPKELIISQTNENELKQQAKSKQIKNLVDQIPEVIELGPNTNITTKDNCPIKNDEIIQSMTRVRLIIFLNEIDQIPQINHQLNYYLQFCILGHKMKYKMDLSLIDMGIIPLRKLKVIYFFINSEENLQTYANSGASLKMTISTENKLTMEKKSIGVLNLPVKQYIDSNSRKKDFYKFFHVEGVPYGWGIQGSIGIIPSQAFIDTSRIIFSTYDRQIYLPNQNFYLCEHLPQEWIDQIKLKYMQSKKAQERNRKTIIQPQNDKNMEESLMNNQSRIYEQSHVEGTLSWKSILDEEIKSYTQSKLKKRKPFNHTLMIF